jgi:molecular chaperone HscC
MAGPGDAAGLPAASSDTTVNGAVRRQAELAKRALSTQDRTITSVIHDGKPVEWTISRDQFDQISEPLMARLRVPMERALRDARVDPDELTRIILAGGASQMPAFRRLIARLFRRLPVYQVNPEEVVARGAAVRAGLVARGAGLEEMVMTDVAPFTLGIETTVTHGNDVSGRVRGQFMPIIERNTVIPTSRSKTVCTVDDNQKVMVLRVFQGESRLVKDNVPLGELKIKLPAGPASKEDVDVRFTYDTSGLLEMQATIVSTGRVETLVIEGNPGVMQPDEIARRLKQLAKLKVHPRDDMENRAVIARAERLFEERLGDTRAMIGRSLGALTAALERQQPDEIEEARKSLNTLLDEIDQNFFV